MVGALFGALLGLWSRFSVAASFCPLFLYSYKLNEHSSVVSIRTAVFLRGNAGGQLKYCTVHSLDFIFYSVTYSMRVTVRVVVDSKTISKK